MAAVNPERTRIVNSIKYQLTQFKTPPSDRYVDRIITLTNDRSINMDKLKVLDENVKMVKISFDDKYLQIPYEIDCNNCSKKINAFAELAIKFKVIKHSKVEVPTGKCPYCKTPIVSVPTGICPKCEPSANVPSEICIYCKKTIRFSNFNVLIGARKTSH